MNIHAYRILTGAALAMVVGTAGAQTYGDQPTARPEDRNAPASIQAAPAGADTAITPDQNVSRPASPSIAPEQNAPSSTQPEAASPSDSTNAPSQNPPLNTQMQAASPAGSTMAPSQGAPSNTQAASRQESTGANPNARLPADKGVTENTPAQAEPSQTTNKVSGQPGTEIKTAQGSKMSGSESSTKSTHPARAAKSHDHSQQSAMKGDKAYQDALRSCAKEQDRNTRDKCLDNAIEQFHRNT